MDAIELLKNQHQDVKRLFGKLEKEDDDEEKLSLFEELADQLAAHATIEEKIFYPAAFASETEDLLREAVEEHLAVKRLLADLLVMEPSEENFDAKIKVLREQVEHHVEEEEGELFKKVRKVIRPEMLEMMGEQMRELFDEEMSEAPSEKVIDQTEQAARLR